ncbi:MAG: hypothetical protein IH613_12785 [Desulfuromonadales bacterium]|nr:hypothetical protein [Desulfuromonadales bacterium]
MVVGFNHNFRYKGEVYHIQTEDSGVKNPNIVTLLYQGGTILASKKTSYADITRVDNLDQVVEELMKEQHKGMLRNLKTGEFDAVIERFQSARNQKSQIPKFEKISAPLKEVTPAAVKSVVLETPPAPPADAQVAQVAPVAAPKPELQAEPRTLPPAAVKPSSSTIEFSLDEVILSYLMGDDK